MKLWQKVILGMIFGLITGYFIKQQELLGNTFIISLGILDKLQIVGSMYTSMLKMIVIPIIFFSILYGITSVEDISSFGRLGSRALILYTISTVFAVCLGIGFGILFEPGVGVHLPSLIGESVKKIEHQTLTNIIVNIIPSNPVQAMANGNTLQVVVFAFFFGVSLVMIGEKGYVARNTISSCAHAVFKMVELVIKITPYGVFAIMSHIVSEYGFKVIFSLGKFVLIVLVAMLVQYIAFWVMFLFFRIDPRPFFRKIIPTQALAFATSSSKATLSTALSEMQKKMGVSKKVSSFVLPLGASTNMSATAIYLGITTVFFSQISGVDLNYSQYGVIIFASTIGSIGAAGFPGGGIVMIGMVLSSVNLPLDGIPLIMGVDRILDMVRTTINITGDCAITLIVDKIEGSLDYKKYNEKIL
ncbi:dicarboxylate/amino acid:cation symporter [Lyticum sinuosum]|uniref:Dicarboxylate/amino acid:cation symporter n=1 Tax=Lyticum sinuosum TaxID=1332059 RepID=A0AAE5AH32_9RICK|nr:dicarboxylate/amino acid:cation symporter [Lyticum sinuosum]MDZ5761115.1 Dicarboxylate/amino acid:cation symporter [Lyticum sinuosum]